MADFLPIVTYYLEDKPIYTPLRKILNLIFNVSITTFIYTQAYGEYKWLDFNDYKGILDFIFKGQLYICASIYLIMYCSLSGISSIIFNSLNAFKSRQIEDQVLKHANYFKDGNKQDESKSITTIFAFLLVLVPIKLIYERKSFSKTLKNIEAIENRLKKDTKTLKNSFNTFLKGLIVITITYFTIPNFGWLLYLLTSTVLTGGLVVTVVLYRYIIVTPKLLREFKHHDEKSDKEKLDKINLSAISNPIS